MGLVCLLEDMCLHKRVYCRHIIRGQSHVRILPRLPANYQNFLLTRHPVISRLSIRQFRTYLYGTRHLAIQYGPQYGQKAFTCSSDAAFSDNQGELQTLPTTEDLLVENPRRNPPQNRRLPSRYKLQHRGLSHLRRRHTAT